MERKAGKKVVNALQPFYELFEDFYEAYYGFVLGYLRKKIKNSADAEEIAGTVFLYCFEHWKEYDPERASQKTWLFLIVRSRWIDYQRRKRGFVPLDDIEVILTENENQIERAMRLEAIRQEVVEGMKRLSANQQKVIIMRYFGDYSDEEIAMRIGITQGNVRVLIHRGLGKLREGLSIVELL